MDGPFGRVPARIPDDDGRDALAAQAGDQEAFLRLIHRYEPLLLNHLRRFTDNEAALQDLRQEAHLEAYRSLSTYRHQGLFFGWLRRIASRVGYRHWARQARESLARTAYLEMLRCHPYAAWMSHPQDQIEGVAKLLAGLGSEDQVLLRMKYVQGLTSPEIAEKMEWNAERVRVRLHRAIKRLRNRHGAGT